MALAALAYRAKGYGPGGPLAALAYRAVLAAAVLPWVGVVHAADEKAAVVTVLAESGTPLRDLKAADFVVKENGKKLQVTGVQLSADVLSLALLLDTSRHSRGTEPTSELRSAASAFVKTVRGANPDAQIALWQYALATSVTVDFTSKAEELDAGILRIFFTQQTAANLIEGLEKAGGRMAGRPGSRRAIVTVDFDSPEGGSDKGAQQAADSIANSGATLWSVSVFSNGSTNPRRDQLLTMMTKASGGKRYSVVDASAVEAKLRAIAASLTSQYLVTFNRVADAPITSLTFETTKGVKAQATPFMR